MSENWGELPLKEDDSEDMLLYSVLGDTVTVGWVPSLDEVSLESFSSCFIPSTIMKSETGVFPVVKNASENGTSFGGVTKVNKERWDYQKRKKIKRQKALMDKNLKEIEVDVVGLFGYANEICFFFLV